MGLLDVMDDPRSMGLLSLGLRLMSTPGKFGTALGQAGMGAMGDYQAAVQTAEQRKFREQQMALQQAAEARAAAAEGRAANLAPINQQVAALQLAAAQAEALKRQQLAAAAADSVLTPNQVAMSTNGGPTMAAAAAAPTTAPGFNWRGYQSRVAAIDPMAALQIEGALKKDMPKLKSVETMRTPDGKLANVALFEDGTTRVLPYGVKPEIVMQALGDKVMAIDKNALPSGASFAMGQSPDSKASNALGYARLNFDRDQAVSGVTYQQDGSGNFVALPTRAAPGSVVRSSSVLAPGGGMTPLVGKSADNLTEDQAKATGWLVQAQNAFKNMQAAIDPKTGTPSAARPGFNDALAAIPSFGATEALANTLRSADRQKFMQASSSLSEALLRAATGAGVNRDEAIQKVRELTPVAGESEATTAQKMASIPLYLKSLEVRAGPGAKKAQSLFAPQVTDPNDPLDMFRR